MLNKNSQNNIQDLLDFKKNLRDKNFPCKREIQKKIRLAAICGMTAAFLTANSLCVYASPPPEVVAESAILVEQNSGKVLYGKNEKERMYPASLTKILTAIVALEHLDPNDIVITGSEVGMVPAGSSIAGHKRGESIKVENLIRGLIIPSGNETACVVAKAVAIKVTGDENLGYNDAEKIFSEMMNEKAKSLGASDSNFVNPHGYHDPDHFTTAYDMALISRAAMEIPLIAKIAKEKEFNSNGAGEDIGEAAGLLLTTQHYKWTTHNELISGGENSYPYATGIKTGFTDEAGHSVSASAEKDGRKLIAVVLFSPDPGRWQDSAKLFDYGFENFDDRVIQKPNTEMEKVMLANYQLGNQDSIVPLAKGQFTKYMSNEEFDRIEKKIEYDEELIYHPEEDEEEEAYDGIFRLKAPLEEGQSIGKLTYTLDGEVIFQDNLICTVDIPERTFKSDRDYYIGEMKKVIFSTKAIPFWIGGVVFIVAIILIIRLIIRRRRMSRNIYRFRGRY